MEDEIKVGEYVRTIDGFIDKVIRDYKGKCNNPNCLKKHISCELDYYCEKEIVKHSSNIIDLIEVGDYVNGWKILSVVITYDKPDEIGIKLLGFDNLLYDINIKSIVTHEQFKSIEYIVKE